MLRFLHRQKPVAPSLKEVVEAAFVDEVMRLRVTMSVALRSLELDADLRREPELAKTARAHLRAGLMREESFTR